MSVLSLPFLLYGEVCCHRQNAEGRHLLASLVNGNNSAMWSIRVMSEHSFTLELTMCTTADGWRMQFVARLVAMLPRSEESAGEWHP